MSGETKAHRELKRAALFWAQVQGYAAAAWEVRVPNCRFRVDVAAYRPEGRGQGGGGDGNAGGPRTAVFECKQSRPDFLNDSRAAQESLDRLRALRERREFLERQLGVHYPHLREGDSLFPEYQSLRDEELGHEGYRKVMKEIGMLERRVYGKTKFEKLVRYRCAHLFYLVTVPGIVEEHEVPLNWGWLEASGGVGEGEGEGEGEDEKGGEDEDGEGVVPVMELVLRKRPVGQELPEGRALAFLERLAVGGTRRCNEEAGVSIGEVWQKRRGGGGLG